MEKENIIVEQKQENKNTNKSKEKLKKVANINANTMAPEESKKAWIKTFKVATITILIIIVISLITVGISSLVSNINEKKRQEQLAIEEANKVTVPNLVGMTYKEAKEEIEKLELKVEAKLGNSEDDDIVTTQDPFAEKRINKGETVTVYLKTPTTKKSDNFYGMRFKKTIEEFCEDYNKALYNEYEQLGENTTALDLCTLERSDFSYYTTNNETNLKQYNAKGINYVISVFIENDSEYIVYACVGCTPSKVANGNNLMEFVSGRIAPAIGSALTELSYKSMLENFSNISEEKGYTYFKDNICYGYREYGAAIYSDIIAISEERYKEITDVTQKVSTSSTESKQTVEEDIKQRISFFNSYYDLNFTPTEKQMQEMIDFANSAENFGNDTLLEFILQKGWTASGTGAVDNSSGGTSNSNNSSSNNKNTNKDTNNNNTSTYKEIKATLNINIKDLINNSTDPEVKTILQSNTLQVSIFVGESIEESEYLMYHGGIDSIPNTITQKFTFETTKNNSVKSKVRIVIDNTSTMIRESTLYDKEITFDKTGTYTIK